MLAVLLLGFRMRRIAAASSAGAAAGRRLRRPACPDPDARSRSRSNRRRSSSRRVRSLRSTTVQPEVEGIVTQIFVKSGDHVRAGTPLVQIDPEQQAAVRSTEAEPRRHRGRRRSTGGSRSSGSKRCVDAGAISRQEFDQAQNSLRTAEARLAALDAQVSEGPRRARLLPRRRAAGGHRRRHPRPRRRSRDDLDGDHDHRRQRGARGLHPGAARSRARSALGLPVQLLDARRQGRRDQPHHLRRAARRRRDADGAGRRALLAERAAGASASQQFVRARIVWRTAPGLTVPVTAVDADQRPVLLLRRRAGPQGGLVARQQPVQVGELVGNDYVVNERPQGRATS